MTAGIVEILGGFFVLAAVLGFVAAAALVSTVLAIVVASFFGLVAGVVAIYVALQLEKAAATAKPKTPGSSS